MLSKLPVTLGYDIPYHIIFYQTRKTKKDTSISNVEHWQNCD